MIVKTFIALDKKRAVKKGKKPHKNKPTSKKRKQKTEKKDNPRVNTRN